MSPRAGLDREKVLAAAAVLVDREGAQGLTVARLAAELEIKPPSLYNHVESLEELQQALAIRGLRRMAAAMRTAVMGLAGADALSGLADAYRRYAMEHPGLYALTLRAREDDAEFSAASHEVLSVVLAVLRGYQLGDVNAIHATRCLRSALHGFVSLEAAGGFGMPYDLTESFTRLVDMLDQGLRS